MNAAPRQDWIDRIRVLAVAGVVLIHVSANVVTDTPVISSWAWWTGNLYDSAARWCIPAFVMLSGALMLTPATAADGACFLRRRLARIALPLLFWSVFSLAAWWARGVVDGLARTPAEALDKLLHGVPHYHLWYLFMLPGLYLAAPALARLCRDTPRKTLWRWAAAAMAAGTALDALNALVLVRQPLFFELWLPYVGYFLCGHLLREQVRNRSVLPAAGAALAGFAATALLTFALAQRHGLETGVWAYSYLSPSVICMSLGMFILLRDLPVTQGPIPGIAPYVLGIYAIHPFFLKGLKIMGFTTQSLDPIVGVPLLTLAALALSLAAVRIMAKAKGLRPLVV